MTALNIIYLVIMFSSHTYDDPNIEQTDGAYLDVTFSQVGHHVIEPIRLDVRRTGSYVRCVSALLSVDDI